MGQDNDLGFAPVDEPDAAALIGTSAVLLQKYVELRYAKLVDKFSEALNVPDMDIGPRLHHQQGIVWEGLPEDRAQVLASILTESGFPSIVVAQNRLVTLRRVKLSRMAAPRPEGVELDDSYGSVTVIAPDKILLAQAGWVSETVDVDRTSPKVLAPFSSTRSYVDSRPPSCFEPVTGEMGWVLHLFSAIEPAWVRVEGRHFNYAYQNMSEGTWETRFKMLIADLAKVIPENCLDDGYKLIGQSPLNASKTAEYRSLHDMIERARWILTLKSLPQEPEHPEDDTRMRKI